MRPVGHDKSPRLKTSRFGGPGLYRVCVQGRVGDTWADRLGGMRVAARRVEAGEEEVTCVEGRVCDQAELLGVLNTLHDLHLPLLLVELIDSDEEGTRAVE